MNKEALLSVDGISVRFGTGRKSFRAVRGW
jgi:hypothetical protein